VNRSEKQDFQKKGQYALELYIEVKESHIQVLYLACFDIYQLKEWEMHLNHAIDLSKWLRNLKLFLDENRGTLTVKLDKKLNEIMQFMQEFNPRENMSEIEFV